jgi:uncharacterized protein
MFVIIITTTVTLLNLYAFGRLSSLLPSNQTKIRRILVGIGISLWIVFLLGRIFRGNDYGFLTVILEVTGMHFLAIAFLLSFCFLVSDIITGFGFFFSKKNVFKIKLGSLLVALVLILISHVQGFRKPIVEKYDISIKELSFDLNLKKAVVLSDLHVGEMLSGERWLNSIIEEVLVLKPDIIFLVGDLFEKGSDVEKLIPIMKRLKCPLGVFAVFGNHDYMRRNGRDVTGEILKGAGIEILENRWAKASDGLIVAGVADLTSIKRKEGENAGEIKLIKTLADRDSGTTILLSHTPWLTDLASKSGVNLMISGHTHNGQIWPFNYIVQIVYPYIQGLYKINDMSLIVSRGTGTWGPRMRLWKRGEISLITLRSK